MPLTAVPTSPLLRNAFTPKGGQGLLTRLLLFSDRIEVRRLGVCTRTVPLTEIEDVTVSSWSDDSVNLSIRVRGDAPLAGRVDAVLAWKYKLMEMLGFKDQSALPTDDRFRLALAA